jgi:hypothetical protein
MNNVRTNFGRRTAAIVALAACGCSGTGGTNPTGAAGFTVLGANGGASGAATSGGGGASPMGGGGSPSSGTGATGVGAMLGAGGVPGSGGATSTGGANGAGGASGAAGASGGVSGAGGAAAGGASGAGGMSGAGGAVAMGEKPPCLKDPKELVMIGDSYVNWTTHTFPADMNAASMLDIADFAVGGTSMGSGGIGLIPPQFDTALMTHPTIVAVIADGGGNDILVPDIAMFPDGAQCKAMGAQSASLPQCQQIVQKALDAGHQLFVHMADKGVKDVVFFFYPHVPNGTWLAADPNGMLDYALPKIKAECDGAYETSLKANPAKPIRCHFVDLVPVFEGHAEYFANADLHPNPTGSKAMAAAVWAKMKQDCVGQPASSGCCAP